MFGLGKFLGERIGETAADVAIKTFVKALIRNRIVIAPIDHVLPEKQKEAEQRTAAVARGT